MLQRGAVGYILGYLERFSAALFNLRRGRPYLLDTPRCWNDIGSSFGHPMRDGASNARCATDHYCNLAVQF